MTFVRIAFFTSTLLALLIGADTHAQVHPDGFYFVVPCAQYIQEPLPVFLTDKKEEEEACITQRPVVAFTSLKSVSRLEDNAVTNYAYFQLEMTPETTQQLRKVFTGMPSNKFAFVLQNEVIFTFEVDPKKFNQFISVSGASRGGKVKNFHNRLQQFLKNE